MVTLEQLLSAIAEVREKYRPLILAARGKRVSFEINKIAESFLREYQMRLPGFGAGGELSCRWGSSEVLAAVGRGIG